MIFSCVPEGIFKNAFILYLVPNGYLEAQVCAHGSFNGLFGILIARPCPEISVRNQDKLATYKIAKRSYPDDKKQ